MHSPTAIGANMSRGNKPSSLGNIRRLFDYRRCVPFRLVLASVVGIFVFAACQDTSAPRGAAGAKSVPGGPHYAQVAIVEQGYRQLGTGTYDLGWSGVDLGNGGAGYGSTYYTPLNVGAFVCGEDCGNYDDPEQIPRAIDNSCDPVRYTAQCLQPIPAADSPFVMHGIDSLWADQTAMPDSVRLMCQRLITQFHHLRDVGHIYSGNNNVSDGSFGPHGGATIWLPGYSDASSHIDQRWLDSTRLAINTPFAKSIAASILLHEAVHSLKYDHTSPDLPENLPQNERYNFSIWPFVLTNYENPAGCVRYP